MNTDDIIKEGLDQIDKEVQKKNEIREQADIIIKDLLSNKYRSKIRIEDTLYLFLLSTGNKLMKNENNEYEKVPTYILEVYDMDKVYRINKDNGNLLESMNKAANIGLEDDNIKISPKQYRPYKFEIEIDDKFEIEQILNTLVSSAVAYLLDEFIVEELPE